MKPYFLLLSVVLMSGAMQGQKLSENYFRSRYTYIFRLDSSQVRLAHQGYKLDSSYYLTHLTDSFNTDSAYAYNRQKHGWGTYFYVTAKESRVYYEVVEIHPFNIEIWGADLRNSIIVKNTEGVIIENAAVTLLNGTICPFNTGTGSYTLPEIPYNTIVKVEYNGRYDYVYVHPDYYKSPPYKPSYPNYSHTTILPGYLVFNQPRFKQYDTLKFKAYLLNDNASPYTKKISVFLRIDYNKEKLIGRFKPATPGAYFGEMLIADTLATNRDYELIFKDAYGNILKSNTFYIENYELKTNTYALTMPGGYNLTRGQRVSVMAQAKDANNLPVMDGTIKLTIRLSGIAKVLKDRLFVPNSWYQNYYTVERGFDPSGYTVFDIPDSLFNAFDGSYEVVAEFANEDHEVIIQTTRFQYTNTSNTYGMHYVNDSLKVDYYYLTKPHAGHFRLVTNYVTNASKSVDITTPYVQATEPTAGNYQLYNGDTLVYTYTVPSNYAQTIDVYGKRSADSITIRIDNPAHIPVYYEIYRKNELVAQGRCVNLRFSKADPSQESYYIIWSHNLFGGLKQNFKIQPFHLFEKRLNISMNQPEEIYPGQTTDIAVKVTDQSDKPVGNVNLTAYAVNTQFGEIPLPDVPYMGLTRNDMPIQMTSPAVYYLPASYEFVLQKQHITALHLFQNELYRLLYGKGGKTAISIPTKSRQPELAAYVYQQQRLQDVVYIKVDKTLIYHKQQRLHPVYSFRVPAGTHDITVRTFDRLLTWKNFIIKDNTKEVICFNMDSLQTAVDTLLAYPGKLTNSEWQEYLNNTLFLHIDNSFDTIVIRRKKDLIYFNASAYNYKPQYMNSVWIDKDQFMAIGPLSQGDITVKQYGRYDHDFSFEPGNAYYMTNDEVKSFTITKFPENLRFFGRDIIDGYSYNLYSFNQTFYDPETPISVDSALLQQQQPAEQKPDDRQRPYVEYRLYSGNTWKPVVAGQLSIISQFQTVNYHSWLMHHTRDSSSVINASNGSSITYYDSGYYDLILFTDTSYCLIRDINLKPAGTLFMFIQPSYFKPINYRELRNYEQVVRLLTKVPMRSFTDTPYTIEPVIIDKQAIKSKYARLSGTVTDARFNTPVDYTNIYAEIAGYFKGGAQTNEDGDFVFDNLPPGTYMLKLRAPGYRYQVIYNLKLVKGMETTIRIRLFHVDDDVYLTEEGITAIEHGYADMDEERYYRNAPAAKGIVESVAGSRNMNDAAKYSATVNATSLNVIPSADGTAMFIDGIRVLPGVQTGAIPAQFGDMMPPVAGDNFSSVNPEQMAQRLEELSKIAQANRVRDRFRDYGYWVPNLVTDKSGMSYFTVKFPDNITSWKTMVPAMNGNRQSGMAVMTTRSYKPLSGNMAAPYYLTEGDQLFLKGRVLNYTGKDLPMHLQFSVNDSIRKQMDDTVNTVLTDRFSIKGSKAGDTLKAAFMLHMNNGYTDGEERRIPVQTDGILIATSRFVDLEHDTVIKYVVAPDIYKAYVLIHNSDVERLLHDIEELKQYGYGCTEQTTSKLRALLVEKAIRKALNMPFTDDRMVKQMISKLNKMRNKNGTWGWWENSSEDLWLTMYVTKTLNDARLAGYSNNVYIKASSVIEKQLPYMSINTQLYALNLLKEMDRDVKYDTFIKKQHPESFSVNDRLLYTRLLQRLGKPYSITSVTGYVQHGINGGLCWGDEGYHYQYDMASSTLLAYDILSQNDTGKQYLPGIRQFFNTNTFSRHTLAMAGLITLQAREWEQNQKQGNSITGDITVNGYHLAAADFPYKKRFAANDTIRISHTGNKAYATIVNQKIVRAPSPDSNYYRIKSSINGLQNNIRLKAGDITTIQVTVEAFKTADQVMIEIPLPAGFSYVSKPEGYGVETHRDYFYNKTSIFCSQLPRGTHTFTISVVPKFSGTMTMPPAKVELMYYPEIHNNEVPKKVTVE